MASFFGGWQSIACGDRYPHDHNASSTVCMRVVEMAYTPHFLLAIHITSCAQRIFVVAVQSILAVIFLLFLLFADGRTRSQFLNRTHEHNSSTYRRLFYRVLSFLVACIGLLDLAVAIWLLRYNEWSVVPLQNWILSAVQGITWLMLSFTVSFSALRPLPIFIRIWWVLTFLLGTYVAVLSGLHHLTDEKVLSAERALAVISWPLSCTLLVCALKKQSNHAGSDLLEPLLNGKSAKGNSESTCDKEVRPTHGNLTPFATAGFLSRMTFWWMNPLIGLGYRKSLAQSDLPNLGQADKSGTAYDAFAAAWENQRLRYPSKNPSLCWTLLLCNWRDSAMNGFFALCKTLLLSAGPLILNLFIQYARGYHLFKHEGYMLVATLLLAKIFESVSQRQWSFGSRRIGMHIRSALIEAIYKKQLYLSNAGRQKHAAGEIINYMSVDAYRIGEFPFSMHQLWTTPLQVVTAITILFYSVGWATSAGLSVVILTMLSNSPLAKLQQRFQNQLMSSQDGRLRSTTEALNNMKVLKLQAWEDEFKSSIERLREVEYRWLAAVQYRKAANTLIFWMSPVLVAIATFGACYFLSVPLTANNIFTTLATLRILQEPIRAVPDLIAVVIQARVSLSRISNFLEDDELQPDVISWNEDKTLPYAVNIQCASLSWDCLSPKPTLKDINMQVKHRQRFAVCGEVGSGKSTLLHAILGEVPKLSGTIEVSGSIAFVAQTAWIQSGTIQENVLFGRQMDMKRYTETLQACALDKDIKSFAFGDLTEIGERGVNISGGQKQRIQLARAVYQDADIYLLDDPFSAVDAHTAASLFKDCIMGVLSDKTVILVTHQVEFLPIFDCILLMQDGGIQQAGKYDDLLLSGSAFEELVNAHLETMGAKAANGNFELSGTGMHVTDSMTLEKQISRINSQTKALGSRRSQEEVLQITEALAYDQLTQEEEKETGDTGTKPYWDYLGQNKGFLYFSLALLSQVIFVVGQVCSNTWMAAKVDDVRTGTARLLQVYSSIAIISVLFLVVRSFFVVTMGLAASRSFFSLLMKSLFRAPMSFFDSTPTGRIMSRVSSDLTILDLDFPFTLIFTIASSLNTLSNLVVIMVATWQALIVILPMICISWWLRGYYFATAKELMRFNGITKSPIVNFFGESIAGATTIRAFKVQDGFMQKNLSLIDNNASPFFHVFAANDWMIGRLEILSATVVCASGMIMILLPAGAIDPGFVGLALSYGLSLNGSLVFSMLNQCMLANYSISVERIKQYMHVPNEAPVIIEGNKPNPSWPSNGKVELQNLQVRYRPRSPLVLHDITCTFEAGQKVGVVGRTGSGKTTLISALFRLVEPVGGRILIDELDITKIGLHDLRSRLSIIPQDPTLFRGTVRFNLDPLSQYSDTKVWEVLDKCQLGDIIREKPEKLDAQVEDDGANWSVGQRQLLCLGRALLKNKHILVLDEATASIDNTTDSILQKTIREEFAGCTVITVAHRIPTVVDSDMVLALKDGTLVEFDHPMKLLERNESLFAKLVAEYWIHSHNAMGNL